MADVIVIAVLVCVLALIVRGMWRRKIRTCDSASCGGSCAGCVGGCPMPRLKLTEEQERELQELDRRKR